MKSYQKIEALLTPFIHKGLNLKEASECLGVPYANMRGRVSRAKFKYPDSFSLREYYCQYKYGLSFSKHVKRRKKQKKSNLYIANELGIAKSTLYKACDKLQIDIKGKSIKLDRKARANIRSARIKRLATSSNSRVIDYQDQTKTVTQWAHIKGLVPNTLVNRVYYLKWPLAEAMETAPGKPRNCGKLKHPSNALATHVAEPVNCHLKNIVIAFSSSSPGPEDEYYMINIKQSSSMRSQNTQEEIGVGTLYVDERGRPCSLPSAAVLSDFRVAKAFFEHVTHIGSTGTVYCIERFKTDEDVSGYDKTNICKAMLADLVSDKYPMEAMTFKSENSQI